MATATAERELIVREETATQPWPVCGMVDQAVSIRR
jgi:hypothetical protein